MRDGQGYVNDLKGFPFSQYKIAVVILHDARMKKAIKALLDKEGIVS